MRRHSLHSAENRDRKGQSTKPEVSKKMEYRQAVDTHGHDALEVTKSSAVECSRYIALVPPGQSGDTRDRRKNAFGGWDRKRS